MTKKSSQLFLHAAVAGLFSATGFVQGQTTTGQNKAPANAPGKAAAKVAKVLCVEGNSCHGTGSCKGASNECKGKNSCGGHVYEAKSEEACKAGGGTPKS